MIFNKTDIDAERLYVALFSILENAEILNIRIWAPAPLCEIIRYSFHKYTLFSIATEFIEIQPQKSIELSEKKTNSYRVFL